MRSRHPDYTLIVTSFLLVIFGLVILASASAPAAFNKFKDSFYYLKHQLIFGFVPGLLAFYFFSRIDYRVWKKFGWGWLGISIVLLILVFIPGLRAEFGSSQSWIRIGGFSAQPAELVKLTFLFFLAFWLERTSYTEIAWLRRFCYFSLFSGSIVGLIVLQPDLGTAIIFFASIMTLYFVYGARWQELVIQGAVALTGFLVMIKIAPYRMARILVFLNPKLDPHGSGYQLGQALLAVGSGGLFGRGFGNSRQKFQYLPEVTSDSIFAIIGEELGFIFSIIVLFLFFVFAMRAVSIARRAPDLFGRYLVVGITAWIIFQAIVNIGGVIGVMPLTGVPLPFISYGGTAMVATLGAVGILTNISKHAKL